MKKCLAIICLLGFVAAVPSVAQTRVLTFQDAIKTAMQNAVLLNQQRNNLESAQMAKLSSIAGLGPTLSGNVGFGRVNGNTFNQQEGRVVNGIFDQYSGSLSANINLFNGFAQVNRARQFSSLADAQSFYINRTIQDVINTVALQYMQVLLDGELLIIAKENHNVLQKQLDQIKEQVIAGSRSPVDEYNQDSQAKAAELRALQAEINLVNDRALLTQTLLVDPTEEFDVAKPSWDANTIGSNTVELTSLLELGLKNRGDYQRALKNEDAARYGMYASKASMTPTFSAYYQLYSAYNRDHNDPAVEPFKTQVKVSNLKQFYGVQLYIPIFGGNQGFQNRSNYVTQKVLYHNNQLLRKNAEVLVKTDVLKAYKNFELVKRTYTVTLDQLKAAEIANQYETERYSLGVTDFVTYLNANKVLVQSQTDKASAEYRLVFQKILLDYAAGTLKPEDLADGQ